MNTDSCLSQSTTRGHASAIYHHGIAYNLASSWITRSRSKYAIDTQKSIYDTYLIFPGKIGMLPKRPVSLIHDGTNPAPATKSQTKPEDDDDLGYM
jgi:hypothetical protein